MLQIDHTLISEEVIDKNFLCDLSSCKGRCCIEGESGAPLEAYEKKLLENVLPAIWGDLSEKARAVIKRQGVCYTDSDGDLVTSIVEGENCVFTCYDEKGCCYCSIEKAYKEGKTEFYKPVSCHLYPVRVTGYGKFLAVNYHQWRICKPALIAGNRKGVKVYRFLKEALIRRFGKEWYDKLCLAAEHLSKG